MLSTFYEEKAVQFKVSIDVNSVVFANFITKKRAVLASKIDKRFIVIGITCSNKRRAKNTLISKTKKHFIVNKCIFLIKSSLVERLSVCYNYVLIHL